MTQEINSGDPVIHRIISHRAQVVADSPITKMKQQFAMVKGQLEQFIDECPDTRRNHFRFSEIRERKNSRSMLITPLYDFRDDDGLRNHKGFIFGTMAKFGTRFCGFELSKPSVQFFFNASCDVTTTESMDFVNTFENLAFWQGNRDAKFVKNSDDILKAFSKYIPLKL